MLVGCAGIWIEAQRCPGAFDTAFYAGAPTAISIAVVLAGLIALGPKGMPRADRISRGVVYGLWASVASVAVTTAGLLVLNERGAAPTQSARCWVERRETHPARNAGVEEWIVVLRCSDRMSLVPVDVDRHTWWENAVGSSVEATLAEGKLGYAWVVDTSIGPPKRLVP